MEGIFAELRKGMVFVDIETGNHQSLKGVTFPSQGTWGREALCSPVCSRPHLVLVTSQCGLCTGIGVPCAFRDWRSRNGELSLINESSPFNNAHHCWVQDGHGNMKTVGVNQSRLSLLWCLTDRGSAILETCLFSATQHPTRKPWWRAGLCILRKEEKGVCVRMKEPGEDVLKTFTRKLFIQKY